MKKMLTATIDYRAQWIVLSVVGLRRYIHTYPASSSVQTKGYDPGK